MPKAHGRAAVQLVLQQWGEQVVRAERGVVPGQPGPAKGLVRLLFAIHARRQSVQALTYERVNCMASFSDQLS